MGNDLMAWLKARLGEGNSRRAIAVVFAVLGATHVLDAETLGAAANSVQQLGLLFLAVDAFATTDGTKHRDDGTGAGG
jgi:hypothetical protein